MNRRSRIAQARLRVSIGLLAGLVFLTAFALQVCAGEVTPGVFIIANHDAGAFGKWQCRVKLMGSLDESASIDEWEGIVIAPKILTTATAGGAAKLDVTRPGFHLISAPAAGDVVSTLRFELDGKTTSFAMKPIKFRFDADTDRLRFGPFSNSNGGAVTLTASAEADGIMTAIVYDAAGHSAGTFFVDLAGDEIVQATYDGPLDAFSIQLVPGCIGWGPCGGAVASYVIATNTSADGAAQTIEVAYGASVNVVSLTQILNEMLLVALHPPTKNIEALAKRRANVSPAEARSPEWLEPQLKAATSALNSRKKNP